MRRPTTWTLSGATVLALALSACGGSSDPIADGPAEGAAVPLGSWVLDPASLDLTLPDGARITLVLEESEGEINAGGTAACNSYGGAVAVEPDGGWRSLGFGMTEMGCEPPLMEAERAYLDALDTVTAWEQPADASLTLQGAGAVLTFTRLTPVEPASMTGTDWVVDGYVTGEGEAASVSTGASDVDPATLRFEEDGTFTLFTGCRDFAGDWATYGDAVTLPSWGETEDSRGVGPGGDVLCDEEAVAQEMDVLAVVESDFTVEVTETGITLRKDDRALTLRPADA